MPYYMIQLEAEPGDQTRYVRYGHLSQDPGKYFETAYLQTIPILETLTFMEERYYSGPWLDQQEEAALLARLTKEKLKNTKGDYALKDGVSVEQFMVEIAAFHNKVSRSVDGQMTLVSASEKVRHLFKEKTGKRAEKARFIRDTETGISGGYTLEFVRESDQT